MTKPRPHPEEPTRIVSTADVMGGEPTIEGTRITPDVIALHIRAGYSRAEIFHHYPGLPPDGLELVASWAAAHGEVLTLPAASLASKA